MPMTSASFQRGDVAVVDPIEMAAVVAGAAAKVRTGCSLTIGARNHTKIGTLSGAFVHLLGLTILWSVETHKIEGRWHVLAACRIAGTAEKSGYSQI